MIFLAIIVKAVILLCTVNYAHQSNLKYQVVKAISGADSNNSSYDFYLLSNGVAKVVVTYFLTYLINQRDKKYIYCRY
jgi:hypothetical protein